MKNMKKLCFLLLFFLSQIGCKKTLLGDETPNTPIDNFDAFWQGMDENYVGFAARPALNWDSIYQVYRPKITTTTTNNDLFNYFKAMMLPFRDQHFVLRNPATYYQFSDTFNHQFLGLDAVRGYLTMPLKGNKIVQYAPIGNVGYVYISDFNGQNPASYYELIDTIVTTFKDQTGLIIDIRDNSGGSETYGKTIASRFTDQTRTYSYNRFKKGKKRDDLSDFQANSFASKGNTPFLKPVLLLTNRAVASSAEDFALMMRSIPSVKLVGDNTAGLIYTRPITRQLPNGWVYWCSVSLLHDGNKNVLTNGIEPDFRVSISTADSIARKDKVLEKAIDLLK
jgi:hypothetical protein